MKWDKLQKVKEAPNYGYVLAYTREQVIFEPFNSLDELENKLKEEELLELHIFNTKKEYRAVVTRSKRQSENCKNGIIETIVYPEEEPLKVYEQEILLEKEYGKQKITVFNYLNYDENGIAVIDNYRLVMKGDCHVS